MILLGKKTIWWRITLVVLTPFWYLTDPSKRKGWLEFKYGLIPHKCEFDHWQVVYHSGLRFFQCKHFGCTIVDPADNHMTKSNHWYGNDY